METQTCSLICCSLSMGYVSKTYTCFAKSCFNPNIRRWKRQWTLFPITHTVLTKKYRSRTRCCQLVFDGSRKRLHTIQKCLAIGRQMMITLSISVRCTVTFQEIGSLQCELGFSFISRLKSFSNPERFLTNVYGRFHNPYKRGKTIIIESDTRLI